MVAGVSFKPLLSVIYFSEKKINLNKPDFINSRQLFTKNSTTLIPFF